MNHPDISEAVILIWQDQNGEHELCAYYCSVQKLNAIDLRSYMASELPEYMIPAKWIWVDSIPLTPNGKVDRAKTSGARCFNQRKPIYCPSKSVRGKAFATI
nr:hypothetical protein P5656_06125 [Bacillus subtilis]